MGRALLASLTLLDGTALVVCMFLCVEPSSFLTFEPILVEGCFFSYNDFRFSFSVGTLSAKSGQLLFLI